MKTILGCKSDWFAKKVMGLCEEKTIDSMIIWENKVYIFRLDYYWVFQLKKTKEEMNLVDLPLIETKVDISSKWPAIDGSKSKFTFHKNGFIAISGHIWMQLSMDLKLGSNKLLFDEQSIETEEKYQNIPFVDKTWAELKDSQHLPEDTGDISEDSEQYVKGAFFKLKDDFFVQIFNDKLVTYQVKNNQWYKTRPVPVRKSEYNFPSNINAVFVSFDGYFYFIRKDKYCKRKLEDKDGVSFESLSFILID